MKIKLIFYFTLGLLAPLCAPRLKGEAVASPAPHAIEVRLRTPAQLDELLGPLALFPDNLVALVLPASVNSSDVVLAARFLRAGGDADKIAGQPWDGSVRALARYPEVVDWLDEHLDWMIDLGEAFTAQPADVMNAIQRLRELARSAGTLVDTSEHRVVRTDGKILILPAREDRIYVPTYDPAVVYVRRVRYSSEPLITFGLGFAIGSWLSYDCDWWHHRVWMGDCYRPWSVHRPWRDRHYVPPVVIGHPPVWRHWSPPPPHLRHRHGHRPPWHPRIGHPPVFPRRSEPWNPSLHRGHDRDHHRGIDRHSDRRHDGDHRRDFRAPEHHRPAIKPGIRSREGERQYHAPIRHHEGRPEPFNRSHDSARGEPRREHRPTADVPRGPSVPRGVVPADRPAMRPDHNGGRVGRPEGVPHHPTVVMPSAPPSPPRFERGSRPQHSESPRTIARQESAPAQFRTHSAPPQRREEARSYSSPTETRSSPPRPEARSYSVPSEARSSAPSASAMRTGSRGGASRQSPDRDEK